MSLVEFESKVYGGQAERVCLRTQLLSKACCSNVLRTNCSILLFYSLLPFPNSPHNAGCNVLPLHSGRQTCSLVHLCRIPHLSGQSQQHMVLARQGAQLAPASPSHHSGEVPAHSAASAQRVSACPKQAERCSLSARLGGLVCCLEALCRQFSQLAGRSVGWPRVLGCQRCVSAVGAGAASCGRMHRDMPHAAEWEEEAWTLTCWPPSSW